MPQGRNAIRLATWFLGLLTSTNTCDWRNVVADDGTTLAINAEQKEAVMSKLVHENKRTGTYRIWCDNSDCYVTDELDEQGVKTYFQMRILAEAIGKIFKEQAEPITVIETMTAWKSEEDHTEEKPGVIPEWMKPVLEKMRRDRRLAEMFYGAIKDELHS